MRFTSPEGPQPFIYKLPSRGDYTIPLYVFIAADITPEEISHLPVVIDFHGGGFFLGSCMEQAPFCAQLARQLRAVVMTVDYRMGPVDKFPAAIEDAEDVLSAVLDESAKGYKELRKELSKRVKETWRGTKNEPKDSTVTLDTSRMCLSGFSSGGNLALNCALSINPPQEGAPWPSRFPQDYKHPLPLLLYYPSFDSRLLPSERVKPPGLPVGNPFWSDVSDVLQPTYLSREQAGHPRASPGLASIKDGGLHPAARMFLVLPELDTLAEQSETWVRKVIAEGRGDDLRVERFKGMQHGWTQMPDQMLNTPEEKKTKKEIHDEAVVFVRDIWDGKPLTPKA